MAQGTWKGLVHSRCATKGVYPFCFCLRRVPRLKAGMQENWVWIESPSNSTLGLSYPTCQ